MLEKHKFQCYTLDGKQIKKVAIYVRVSTDKQEVDNQLLQLRVFAAKNKWDTFNEYVDICSGKDLSRKNFTRLFNDAGRYLFDVVLFWDLARFSRRGSSHTLNKLEELERYKIEWCSYTEPYLRSMGPFKDVILSLLASVAKFEREKISERTKAGLERARSQGIKLGRPTKPNKKELRHQVLQKQREGFSINRISKILNISYGLCWNIIKKGVYDPI